jgi:hypothetical protein
VRLSNVYIHEYQKKQIKNHEYTTERKVTYLVKDKKTITFLQLFYYIWCKDCDVFSQSEVSSHNLTSVNIEI